MGTTEAATHQLVCNVTDVPVGEGVRFVLAELPEPVAIFNDDGRFYALSDTCSHADASLADGEVADCQVECPLHWARFDLVTGKALSLPALLPVQAYSVSVIDGAIYLALPKVAN
ncbi:nitrite reductase/ring-hydroxylating ferredoxin subunit [Nocardioides massiliensis]|uniref:Nitrite reductase/ring-hydroxylating ferredoxin subunit n=2 Tax=Nocardioides massiliensis TaxID=1325935 RepID=A0ABT9NT94_9ACTN|nr:bifunctional 3-phenylpropionate/cinnamic acid dioxygenase ferredoxin subunit [Nocardioides massiliensis]MDP9823631.1 nitrite reductase/ring-hydroxylating ferredoxin subunit [Nocardioides massiliensis]